VLALERQHKGTNASSTGSPEVDEEQEDRPLVEARAFSFVVCFDTVGWRTGKIIKTRPIIP